MFCRKAATHDSEIRYLYEEMEAQINNEKDRLLLKVLRREVGCGRWVFQQKKLLVIDPSWTPPLRVQDSERLQLRSHDLQFQLSSKEKELENLFQKQKKVHKHS